MKLAQKSFNRIKEILKNDKQELSSSSLLQIKSDIYDVLKNYFEITINDINVNYRLTEQNKYNFEVSLISDRIKKNRICF
ncbi:MAG: cell division topological specificity factor MinE [Clostridia bacterium]|nr:cell division topological specificity factor MinE [Clostridia bacterium]